MGAATRPHTVPIVFAPANGKLYSPIDGKPKSTANLQRLRNVRAHPRFSLLLDHYAEDWRALWWLRLDGTARVEQPIARQRRDIADALRTKYPQYQDTPVLRDDGLLLELDWHSVAGWAFAGDVNDQLRQL